MKFNPNVSDLRCDSQDSKSPMRVEYDIKKIEWDPECILYKHYFLADAIQQVFIIHLTKNMFVLDNPFVGRQMREQVKREECAHIFMKFSLQPVLYFLEHKDDIQCITHLFPFIHNEKHINAIYTVLLESYESDFKDDSLFLKNSLYESFVKYIHLLEEEYKDTTQYFIVMIDNIIHYKYNFEYPERVSHEDIPTKFDLSFSHRNIFQYIYQSIQFIENHMYFMKCNMRSKIILYNFPIQNLDKLTLKNKINQRIKKRKINHIKKNHIKKNHKKFIYKSIRKNFINLYNVDYKRDTKDEITYHFRYNDRIKNLLSKSDKQKYDILWKFKNRRFFFNKRVFQKKKSTKMSYQSKNKRHIQNNKKRVREEIIQKYNQINKYRINNYGYYPSLNKKDTYKCIKNKLSCNFVYNIYSNLHYIYYIFPILYLFYCSTERMYIQRCSVEVFIDNLIHSNGSSCMDYENISSYYDLYKIIDNQIYCIIIKSIFLEKVKKNNKTLINRLFFNNFIKSCNNYCDDYLHHINILFYNETKINK